MDSMYLIKTLDRHANDLGAVYVEETELGDDKTDIALFTDSRKHARVFHSEREARKVIDKLAPFGETLACIFSPISGLRFIGAVTDVVIVQVKRHRFFWTKEVVVKTKEV